MDARQRLRLLDASPERIASPEPDRRDTGQGRNSPARPLQPAAATRSSPAAVEPSSELLPFLEAALVPVRASTEPCAVLLANTSVHRPTGQPLPAWMRPGVLQAIGAELAAILLPSDRLEWTLAGEYCVVLPGAGIIGALGTANRVRRACAELQAPGGRDVVVAMRIGIAIFPDDAADAASLLRFARNNHGRAE